MWESDSERKSNIEEKGLYKSLMEPISFLEDVYLRGKGCAHRKSDLFRPFV